MSEYRDARIALDLAFKATDPERRQAGIDWLRQIVDGLPETRPLTPMPELPDNFPNPPKGYIYYGRGPLKIRSHKLDPDIACLNGTGDTWATGYEGFAGHCYYALRKGSEIARLNGLP